MNEQQENQFNTLCETAEDLLKICRMEYYRMKETALRNEQYLVQIQDLQEELETTQTRLDEALARNELLETKLQQANQEVQKHKKILNNIQRDMQMFPQSDAEAVPEEPEQSEKESSSVPETWKDYSETEADLSEIHNYSDTELTADDKEAKYE